MGIGGSRLRFVAPILLSLAATRARADALTGEVQHNFPSWGGPPENKPASTAPCLQNPDGDDIRAINNFLKDLRLGHDALTKDQLQKMVAKDLTTDRQKTWALALVQKYRLSALNSSLSNDPKLSGLFDAWSKDYQNFSAHNNAWNMGTNYSGFSSSLNKLIQSTRALEKQIKDCASCSAATKEALARYVSYNNELLKQNGLREADIFKFVGIDVFGGLLEFGRDASLTVGLTALAPLTLGASLSADDAVALKMAYSTGSFAKKALAITKIALKAAPAASMVGGAFGIGGTALGNVGEAALNTSSFTNSNFACEFAASYKNSQALQTGVVDALMAGGSAMVVASLPVTQAVSGGIMLAGGTYMMGNSLKGHITQALYYSKLPRTEENIRAGNQAVREASVDLAGLVGLPKAIKEIALPQLARLQLVKDMASYEPALVNDWRNKPFEAATVEDNFRMKTADDNGYAGYDGVGVAPFKPVKAMNGETGGKEIVNEIVDLYKQKFLEHILNSPLLSVGAKYHSYKGAEVGLDNYDDLGFEIAHQQAVEDVTANIIHEMGNDPEFAKVIQSVNLKTEMKDWFQAAYGPTRDLAYAALKAEAVEPSVGAGSLTKFNPKKLIKFWNDGYASLDAMQTTLKGQAKLSFTPKGSSIRRPSLQLLDFVRKAQSEGLKNELLVNYIVENLPKKFGVKIDPTELDAFAKNLVNLYQKWGVFEKAPMATEREKQDFDISGYKTTMDVGKLGAKNMEALIDELINVRGNKNLSATQRAAKIAMDRTTDDMKVMKLDTVDAVREVTGVKPKAVMMSGDDLLIVSDAEITPKQMQLIAHKLSRREGGAADLRITFQPAHKVDANGKPTGVENKGSEAHALSVGGEKIEKLLRAALMGTKGLDSNLKVRLSDIESMHISVSMVPHTDGQTDLSLVLSLENGVDVPPLLASRVLAELKPVLDAFNRDPHNVGLGFRIDKRWLQQIAQNLKPGNSSSSTSIGAGWDGVDRRTIDAGP